MPTNPMIVAHCTAFEFITITKKNNLQVEPPCRIRRRELCKAATVPGRKVAFTGDWIQNSGNLLRRVGNEGPELVTAQFLYKSQAGIS